METSGIATAYDKLVAAQATLNATIEADAEPEALPHRQASSQYGASIEALFSYRPKSLLEIRLLLTALTVIEYELQSVRKAVTNIIESELLG